MRGFSWKLSVSCFRPYGHDIGSRPCAPKLHFPRVQPTPLNLHPSGGQPSFLRPPGFDEEQSADLRRHYARHALHLAAAFAVLFALVFLALRWSGAAVRFSAARVSDSATATWHIAGVVRSSVTHQPVPWATVEDDPHGRPPLYRTEADQFGTFQLLTLPEPHRIRVSAAGFHPLVLPVGRMWFLWLPEGSENRNVYLTPE